MVSKGGAHIGVRLMQELIDDLPIGLTIWRLDEDDRTLRLVRGNRCASRLLGVDLATAAGLSLRGISPAISEERETDFADTARAGVLRRTADGSNNNGVADAAASGIPLPGRCVGVLFEDAAMLTSAAQEARRAQAFLHSIVENVPAMIFVKDADSLRFQLFNRAGEELLGMRRDLLIGKNDYDFFPREQADFFQSKDREVLRGGQIVDIPEEPIDTAHGQRWLHTRKIPVLDAAGRPLHLLGISMDITEAKRAAAELQRAHDELEARVQERTAELSRTLEDLRQEITVRQQAEEALHHVEEQLRQAQKMEAIGRLAGGIAHDFNNLLSVINGYSTLILRGGEIDDVSRAQLQDIQTAGERAADLTKQLLAFSRRQVLAPRVMSVNTVVAGMENLVKRLVGEDIDVRICLADGLAHARIDPAQIEQVIMNLVVNARDAMPSGGMLTIETGNVDLDQSYVDVHVGTTPGPHVLLAIADTGCGMDKDTQARVFEPFFTTKPVGRGSGLGLATVDGIVRQHGGSIWLYSEPGKGSTFKIYFPSSAEAEATMVANEQVAEARTPATILLVEDDGQVRVLARHILVLLGYQVLDASDAGAALTFIEHFSGDIHLLLTDVVMPRMSGRELAERVLSVRPRTRVLYMSGYTENAIVHHGVLDANVAFLQKPITPDALARKVREVLEGTGH